MNQIFGPVISLYEANYTSLNFWKVDSLTHTKKKRGKSSKLEASGENLSKYKTFSNFQIDPISLS